MVESKEETIERITRERNYVEWINRLKNEKIFSFENNGNFFNKMCIMSTIPETVETITNESKFSFVRSNSQKAQSYYVDLLKETDLNVFSKLRVNSSFIDKIERDLDCEDYEELTNIFGALLLVLKNGAFEKKANDLTRSESIYLKVLKLFEHSCTDVNARSITNDTVKIIGMFSKFLYVSNRSLLSFSVEPFLNKAELLFGFAKNELHTLINYLKSASIIISTANLDPNHQIDFYKKLRKSSFIEDVCRFAYVASNNYKLLTAIINVIIASIWPKQGEIKSFPVFKQEGSFLTS